MKIGIDTQATLSMRALVITQNGQSARDVINNAGPMIQAAIEEIPEENLAHSRFWSG